LKGSLLFFWLEIQFLCCGHEKNKGFQGIKYDEYRTFMYFFLHSKVSNQSYPLFSLRQNRNSFEIFSSWLCIITAMNLFKSTQLTKGHR